MLALLSSDPAPQALEAGQRSVTTDEYAASLLDVCRADGAALAVQGRTTRARICRGVHLAVVPEAELPAPDRAWLMGPDLSAARRASVFGTAGLMTLASGGLSLVASRTGRDADRSVAYDVVAATQLGMGVAMLVYALATGPDEPAPDRVERLRGWARAQNAVRVAPGRAPVRHPASPVRTASTAVELDPEVAPSKVLIVAERSEALFARREARIYSVVRDIVPSQGGGETSELVPYSGSGQRLTWEEFYARAGLEEEGASARADLFVGRTLTVGGVVLSVSGAVMSMYGANADGDPGLFAAGVASALVGAGLTAVGYHLFGAEPAQDEAEAIAARHNARARRGAR